MTVPPSEDPPASLRSLMVRWGTMIALTLVLVAALRAARLPAALFLGPMLAGGVMAVRGVPVTVPRWSQFLAQALIGGMVAGMLKPGLLRDFLGHWPLFLFCTLAVITLSGGLGWMLARWRVLPGTVAVWGSSPGAATAMTVMAGDYGADVRLVAFMQYLRVVVVAFTASMVARIWVPMAGHAVAVDWFPSLAWPSFAATLALVLGAGGLGQALRIPAGVLLLPLAAGAVAQGMGLLTLTLPPWLLALGYALIGWRIGSGFTPAILAHAARALPRVLAAIIIQIALCAGLGWGLTRWAGVDPLTAYLATSPGGADSVAIIAAGSPVDVSFIMAQQTTRLLLIMLLGPRLARFVADRVGGDA